MRSFRAGVTGILLSTLVLGAVVARAQSKTKAAPGAPAVIAPVAATPAKPAAPASVKPAVATVAVSEASKPAPKAVATTGPRSIVGEVVDPACWIVNGVSGKAHAECAVACAKAGQTLAILEKRTNKLYILAGDKPGEDPNKGVMEFVGVPVLVKGRVFSRHGALGIQVASVEAYNARPIP